MIGAGGIAGVHLAGWLALGARVRVYSTADAERLVAGHHLAEVAPSLQHALDGADVVDVCTPTFAHPDVVLAAAAAGCDVVCEKPLASTSAVAAEMVDACERAGVRIFPAHVVRFFPEYTAMQRHVAAGGVGDIAVQRFTRSGSRPVRDWFADDDLSGGIVMDQMIHDLDFARWTAGEVERVFARRAVGPDEGGVRGVVSAQAILTHASGAVSYVTGTWAAPGSTFRTTFEVAGTGGIVHHDSVARAPLAIDGGAAGESRGLLPGTAFTESPFLTELRAFLTAFRGGPPPPVSAHDGVQAVRLAEAANASIASGQAVELSNDDVEVLA
nr:Gfo/Idh/MocA family oxidoreductase [Phytoactinopolyspora alkaliphila]